MWDYPVTVIVAGVLSYIGSVIAGYLGFFTIFVAPVAGVIIAEAVRFAVRRRRARTLPLTAAAATLVAGLIIPLFRLFLSFSFNSAPGLLGLVGLLWPAIYAILAASTVYYRLGGIRL
jgi:hypothetical protein